MAEMLAGSWRRSPPAFEASADELAEIAPLLCESGAAGLGWWHIRHSNLRTSPAALDLQQAYRFQTLQVSRHEREIQEVFALLRSAGVEPILIKGWAIARFYPEKGLRPSGDIDICVRKEQYRVAEATLQTPEGRKYFVDLYHKEFDDLDDSSKDELYSRSQLVRLGELEVRVLGPEDHLRLLCLHLLRHGARRPLWLCDVAVAVESRPADFDWDRCLGRNRRQANWIVCTIGLAHQLLGANIADTPIIERIKDLPNWLVSTVLKQWDSPYFIQQQEHMVMAARLRQRSGLLQGLRNRWPNAIEATISFDGPFNRLPRLHYQLGIYLSRAAMFTVQLPKKLREQK